MEYLILPAALAVLMIILFVREAVWAKRQQEDFIRSLRENYGSLPDKKYTLESCAHITGYYQRHQRAGQTDDITWNDLNLDDVFRRMNYTLSATGEEYLYYLLRDTGTSMTDLERLEEVVSWFQLHEKERVQVQFLMSGIGYTGKYSLYDYIENLDELGERSNRRHYIADALFLPLIALMPFELAVSLLGIALLGAYQIIRYFRDKNEIDPYVTSFAYLTRLFAACEQIAKIPMPACGTQIQKMQEYLGKLQGIRSGSYWVFSSRQNKTSGNPLEVLMDYIRMVFHVDLIVFNKMLHALRTHLDEVDGLITQAGYLEAAISIGAFRASLKNGWCLPELTQEEQTELFLEEGYHPLLEQPVKNTIRARRGVLITGSNASGKSTFLKTVALNAILAQTIHTCTAEHYRAPFFCIYSSMALRDDLQKGESYYIVEIKALKRILDAAGEGSYRILCFVDEVLRGTNTVERIAASTQILMSLTKREMLCFAATHDMELADLLREEYDNYHFEDEIQDGDISFSYKLLQGKSQTRNAIRLLEIMGYEPDMIEQAFRRANIFLETGSWQA